MWIMAYMHQMYPLLLPIVTDEAKWEAAEGARVAAEAAPKAA